jgi:hypothetical protein
MAHPTKLSSSTRHYDTVSTVCIQSGNQCCGAEARAARSRRIFVESEPYAESDASSPPPNS